MLRRLLLISLLFASTTLRADCTLSASDRAFVDSWIDAWNVTSRDALKLAPAPLPLFVFFDEHCVYHGQSPNGIAHDGKIKLPNDEEIPARLITFAATYDKDAKPFLVMSLPSVWRADPRHAKKDAKKVEETMSAVFIHEMTHTRQSGTLGEQVGALITKYHLPDDIDDDVVQKKFGDRPAFRAAYEKEVALFYEAAQKHDRKLAAEGLAAMRARRAMLTGNDHAYAELEDVFLGMEGAANWAGYRNLARTMSDTDAVNSMRGSRKWWTQDEGLAVFLVLDTFLPGWQKQAFGEHVPSLESMLAAAVSKR